MESRPEGLRERDLLGRLTDAWNLDLLSARYAPVGFGSYHWDVTDAAGRRHFVTVDDLDAKGWLGDDRESAFAGLRTAFDLALALRRDAGLEFVVAPVPTPRGETVLRVGRRHSVAVFPFVEGSARSSANPTPAERTGLVRLLADLHRATPAALPAARARHLDLPRRPDLEAALRDLRRPWSGGPFSERAREVLARHASGLARRLEEFDRLAAAARMEHVVITHGEPHAGNTIRAAGRLLLVDWDTVGMAAPERDLWMVAGHGAELALYTEITGRSVDRAAIDLYRLRWALDDISVYTRLLRSAHVETADVEKAWLGLHRGVQSEAG